jgi:hypothetical protein
MEICISRCVISRELLESEIFVIVFFFFFPVEDFGMKVAKNIALGSSRIVLIFFVIVICYEKNNLKKNN